jgi:hypothetical protein
MPAIRRGRNSSDEEEGMPQVKVRRRGVSAEAAVAALRSGLGQGVQISQHGPNELDVRKGFFARAKVSISEEPGGTVFEVRGAGAPVPLVYAITRYATSRGIARRVAAVIDEEFRDDS